jgi:hypothetical protein
MFFLLHLLVLPLPLILLTGLLQLLRLLECCSCSLTDVM